MNRAGRGLAAVGRLAPTGSLSTLGGIAAAGIGGLGSLVIATRSVTPSDRPALAATWTLVFLVGPAIFFPLEQALAGRLLRADGAPSRATISSTAGGLTLSLVVIALVTTPLYFSRLLDSRPALLGAVVLSFAGYGAQHVARAHLLAGGQFVRYAAVLGLDGLIRLAGCAGAALVGSTSPEPYAWAIGAAPLLATALGLAGLSRPPRLAAPRNIAAFNSVVAWLIVGSLCAQAVIGVGPAALKLMASGRQDVVPAYLVLSSLARIPLLLGQALLAPLLAGLAASLAAGRVHAYRRELGRTLAGVAAFGFVTTVCFSLSAPAFVPQIFDISREQVSVLTTAILGGCAVAFLMAQLLTQALVARAKARQAALCWLAAAGAFASGLGFLPGSLGRVLGATTAGCLVAVATLLPAAWQFERSVPRNGPDVPTG